MVAEGLLCPRGGSDEQRQKIVDIIKERQESIEQGKSNMSPICIFPEGQTSNNTAIGAFHRGAFESLCAV
jgi:1-acyl-sn-glycerol-3-phosphate acyltransferase